MTTAFLTFPALRQNDRRSIPRTAPRRQQTHQTIRAQQPSPPNSPQHLPSPCCHTPYPSFPSEGDTLDTQFEQPPGGAPPPPSTWSQSEPDDDSDLPPDLREALAQGALTASALARYRAQLRNPVLAFLHSIPAFRVRALADSSFLFKLLVQELVGNGTTLLSEIVVRGKDIVHELEYVASDLAVGTVVEAAFVWLLAPVLTVPTKTTGFLSFMQALPAHVFQPSGMRTFTTSARLASFLVAGLQYAMIGFVAGVVGTGITYGLIKGRKMLDKNYHPERPLPEVLPSSLGWAAFMALSSNPRFQIVEGLELVVRRCNSQAIANCGIVALRLVNNYYGGVQFVQFFRFLGLHATGDVEEGESR